MIFSSNLLQNEFGVWEIFLPNNTDGSPAIPHGSRVKVTKKSLHSFFCHLQLLHIFIKEMISLLQTIIFRIWTEYMFWYCVFLKLIPAPDIENGERCGLLVTCVGMQKI